MQQSLEHDYEVDIGDHDISLDSIEQQARENKQAMNFLDHLVNQMPELKY